MIKNTLSEVKEEIGQWLATKDLTVSDINLERSADAKFGDFTTNVAMRHARDLSTNPLELAENLKHFLTKKNIAGVGQIEIAKPGFVNIFIADQTKIDQVNYINEQGNSFGNGQSKAGQKWVIEHTSPNPNKAMHLGHLRNNLIGSSIVNLLKAHGAEVVSDGIYNNRGIAIAKNMYGFLFAMRKTESLPVDLEYWYEHQTDWLTPAEKGISASAFATECYVAGEEQFQADEQVEMLVRQLVIDWEAGEEKTWELWRLVLSYAYEGIETTMKRLNSGWDHVWYEHEHYKEGKAYVEKGLEKGIFKKLEDGGVLTQIEADYNIPETILLKKDGTSLYITQDIALTDLKKKRYDADKLVWVVGPEQTLALKQLFAVCEQLGIGQVEDFTHIPYGYVGLKGADGNFQKMSSRSGTAVLIDDLLDQIKSTIKTKMAESGSDESVAEALTLAAIKFAFLKSDSHLDMLFDINQSVDVQGDSGLYVMYTYVRTQSILRKAKINNKELITESNIELGEESELVRLFQYYEDVVSKSVDELSVHHVTQYLLELSSEFNSWYAKETILDGSERESHRLAIVSAVGQVIGNGFDLLGIKVVDEM